MLLCRVVASLTGVASEVIAIDCKTVRRSRGAKAAIHMVSAFAARQRLVPGQVKVEDKANEIVAIPRLLEMLAIEGAIVTIDAMGVSARDRAADHHPEGRLCPGPQRQSNTLHSDVRLFFDEQKARHFFDSKSSRHETVDGDHSRIETWTTSVIHNIAWRQNSMGGLG